MDQNDNSALRRRSLITGAGLVTAGLVAGATVPAHKANAARKGFEPARHKIDSWFDELPGDHRVFVDSASTEGGAEAVGYANNLLIATASAYAGEPAEMAIVVCFRHLSTPFGYNDAMWKKYGASFNSMMQLPGSDTAPESNPVNSTTQRSLGNRGVTIDALVARNVHFAVCNMATQLFASVIANETQQDVNAVHDELVANGVSNSHFVSAGVMGLTRAQEYGYSVLIAG